MRELEALQRREFVAANRPVCLSRPSRYGFFLVWGHGLPFFESILETIRSTDTLKILKIEIRPVKNMRKFVMDLYGCDPVPVEHLRSKLAYLFKVPPKIGVILIKNQAPREEYFGRGAFRHIQCAHLKEIKEKIRNQHNPRINERRTEDHVVHCSDYEEQVDYFLKLLGHPGGIETLSANQETLPFEFPFHIRSPKSYTYRKLPLSSLRAAILVSRGTEVGLELREIANTPHFLSLSRKSTDYHDYLLRFRYHQLTDDHSLDRLIQLGEASEETLLNLPPIIVRAQTGFFRILDGVHRSAVALFRNKTVIRCVEFHD